MSEIHSEQDLAQTCAVSLSFASPALSSPSGQPPEAVNECVQQHIPVVGINRQPTIPGVDYVCSDNAAGAELAADQLLRSGCQRLATTILPLGRPHARGSVRPGAANARSGRRTPPAILACQQEGYAGGLQAGARRRGTEDLLRQRPACLWLLWNAPARQRLRRIFS